MSLRGVNIEHEKKVTNYFHMLHSRSAPTLRSEPFPGNPRLMTVNLQTLTDAQLLTQVAQGHHKGLTVLISRHYRPFMAMALANSLSRADSEEAVSNAFIKVWRSAAHYKNMGIDPKYWLRSLMRHSMLDTLRKVERSRFEQSATKRSDDGEFLGDDYGTEATTVDAAQLPPNQLEAKQENTCFDACLNALSEAHRDTLQRALIAGQTETEIARQTFQPLGTVKSRKHTAVKKMQLCVADCMSGSSRKVRI